MKRFLQSEDVPCAESSTEVSGRDEIRNSFGAQCVQISFVLSSQFEMLQTRTAGEQVAGHVEHMIGFTAGQCILKIGQMRLMLSAIQGRELGDDDAFNIRTFQRQMLPVGGKHLQRAAIQRPFNLFPVSEDYLSWSHRIR